MSIKTPTRQALAVAGRAKKLAVMGRLKQALDAMVWGTPDGKFPDWIDAAQYANLTRQSMRKALLKPHVRAYLREQRRALERGGRRDRVSGPNVS